MLGIAGKKLLEDDPDATTEIFVMINHPVFFATDPNRYLSFMQDANSGQIHRKLLIPFDLGARGTLIALATRSSKITNPVETRYWSMVPYQLGTESDRKAVKYSARPCSATVDPIPQHPGHDFLRDALRNTLQASDACMEVLVQPFRSGRSMALAARLGGSAGVVAKQARLQAATLEGDVTHTEVQSWLRDLGHALRFKVWIASNDRSRTVGSALLCAGCLTELPTGLSESSAGDSIGLIDILWIAPDGGRVVAAFEVEHTTSIYSGIVRMLDLALGLPEHAADRYFLVAPDEREAEVRA